MRLALGRGPPRAAARSAAESRPAPDRVPAALCRWPGIGPPWRGHVPPENDARIWVSADWNRWQPLDAPFPGTGNPQAGRVVVGRQTVAVGDPIGGGQGVGVAIRTIP